MTISPAQTTEATVEATHNHQDDAEILRLVKQYQEKGCNRAMGRLVRRFDRMCHSFAMKYNHRFEHEDTFQDARLALLVAVKEFDTSSPYSFFSYAYSRVSREIGLKKILQWSPATLPSTKSFLKAFRYAASKMQSLDMTQALADEISEKIGVAAATIIRAHAVYRSAGVSLDLPLGDSEATLLETLVGEGSPEDFWAEADDQANRLSRARKALGVLSPRETEVIKVRKLLEEPLTLREAADQFGVTGERVRQIESAALKKMRLVA